jgi:hypothetical protein
VVTAQQYTIPNINARQKKKLQYYKNNTSPEIYLQTQEEIRPVLMQIISIF